MIGIINYTKHIIKTTVTRFGETAGDLADQQITHAVDNLSDQVKVPIDEHAKTVIAQVEDASIVIQAHVAHAAEQSIEDTAHSIASTTREIKQRAYGVQEVAAHIAEATHYLNTSSAYATRLLTEMLPPEASEMIAPHIDCVEAAVEQLRKTVHRGVIESTISTARTTQHLGDDIHTYATQGIATVADQTNNAIINVESNTTDLVRNTRNGLVAVVDHVADTLETTAKDAVRNGIENGVGQAHRKVDAVFAPLEKLATKAGNMVKHLADAHQAADTGQWQNYTHSVVAAGEVITTAPSTPSVVKQSSELVLMR